MRPSPWRSMTCLASTSAAITAFACKVSSASSEQAKPPVYFFTWWRKGVLQIFIELPVGVIHSIVERVDVRQHIAPAVCIGQRCHHGAHLLAGNIVGMFAARPSAEPLELVQQIPVAA